MKHTPCICDLLQPLQIFVSEISPSSNSSVLGSDLGVEHSSISCSALTEDATLLGLPLLAFGVCSGAAILGLEAAEVSSSNNMSKSWWTSAIILSLIRETRNRTTQV